MKKLLLIFALWCLPIFAQTTVAPVTNGRLTFNTSAGLPCAGCLLYTYVSGTTTLQATYTDYTGGATNANPVVLDSSGSHEVWLVAGVRYKLVLKSAAGAQIWSVDGLFAGGAPASPDQAVQFNNGGLMSGDSLFLWNATLHQLSINGKAFDPANSSCTAGQQLTLSSDGTKYSCQSKPVFDVRDYGCVADGSTDNSTCMQAAISAAIAATTMGAGDAQTATVLCPDLPGPSNFFYYIAKPLVIHGGNVRFVGNGRGSCLLTSFGRGPMMAVGPSTGSAFHDAASNIAVASPTAFATAVKSFNIAPTDGNGPYWLAPTDSSALSGLNGLTAFTLDFWTYLTVLPNNSALIGSATYLDNDSAATNPLQIYSTDGASIRALVRINGADRAVGGNAFSLNAWHHIALTYDGTTARLFVDGVGAFPGAFAGSLQIPRRTWIVTNCAPGPNFDNGCPGTTSPTGYISALRVSNSARWVADFTPPARVNPTADANTLLLCNFDNQYDIFTGCTEGGSSTISWLPIHRSVNAQVANVEVSNISFNGKGSADGMWIYGATDSRFDNMYMTQVRRGMVFHSDTLTFQNYSHGVEILNSGPASSYDTFGILGVGSANGITTFSKAHVIAAAFPFYWETGSVKFDQPEATPNAATVSDFYFDGSATNQQTVMLTSPQIDNEAGITNYVSDITLRNVGSFTSIGGTFGGFANAVPLFNIVGTNGGAYSFISPTFIQANTAPSIFHIINNPLQPISIVNPLLLGGITGVPFVDAANQASVFGNPGSTSNLAYSMDKAGKVIAVGVSATLTNSTLTGASSGNSVNLLNAQGAAAPIVGTGAPATVFTYTLPGNVLGAGKCMDVEVGWTHSTGTASVSYTFLFGGTTVATDADAGTAFSTLEFRVCNNPAVTNAQTAWQKPAENNAVLYTSQIATPAETTTAGVVAAFKFNVANTDQVTPKFFRAVLVQ